MIWQLGVLLLVGSLVLAFAYLRQDAEIAVSLVRRSCQNAGLQWLDQSVHLHRLSWHWQQGPLLRREYRFDFSRDGQQRHLGYLRLDGPRLVWLFIEGEEGVTYLEGG